MKSQTLMSPPSSKELDFFSARLFWLRNLRIKITLQTVNPVSVCVSTRSCIALLRNSLQNLCIYIYQNVIHMLRHCTSNTYLQM